MSRLLSSIYSTDGIVHTIDTIDTTATPAVISADSPSVPGVGNKVDKKDKKDIRTPPPPLKEALGDIYGGDSREELELDNGPKPLAATQGTINTSVILRFIS